MNGREPAPRCPVQPAPVPTAFAVNRLSAGGQQWVDLTLVTPIGEMHFFFLRPAVTRLRERLLAAETGLELAEGGR